MLRAGFTVPEGFVLTTSAFHSFLKENGLNQQKTQIKAEATHIPEDVEEALKSIQTRIGGGLLAVRSSGVSEDLPNASFAGQYETVLGVKNRAELEDAIKRCWLSTFSDRAGKYTGRSSNDGTMEMAVLIQKLVRAEASGVAFTINPVTGANEVVVNAVRGLGDRLVSGVSTPDEWIVGNNAVPTIRIENSISEKEAIQVAELARKVEAYFGSPQDIEWAISGARLFLLQARPITTRVEHATEADIVPVPITVPEGYWTLDKEHFPQPLSPMFVSIALEEISNWVRMMTRDVGLPFEGIDFKIIGGWEYGRVVPPGGKDRKPPPAWLMGVIVRIVPSVRSQVRKMQETVRNDLTGQYISRWREEWKPELVKLGGELLAVDVSALPDDQLDSHLESVLTFGRRAREIHFRYLAIIMLDVGYFGTLCQEYLKWDTLRVFEPLAGLSTEDSEQGRRVAQMARLTRENPALVEAIKRSVESGNPEIAFSADPSLREGFANYMRDFGWACLGYDLTDPTLSEMPVELLRLIEIQATGGYDPSAIASQLEMRRSKTEEEIDRASLPEEVRSEIRTVLTRAREAYAIHDEETFYTQHMSNGVMRRALLEIGSRLVAKRVINAPNDVFMLRLDEAKEAMKNGGNKLPLVSRRYGERKWALANQPPSSYGTSPPPPPSLSVFPIEAQRLVKSLMWALAGISLGKASTVESQLSGIPASPGTYEGEVRVIRNESEFGRLRAGDVLVCVSTTPSWSVIFPAMGALVTEAGGVLSHPAIVAREYGIPAVLSLEGATLRLRDGQRVRVDGATGTVTLVA